MQTKVHFVYTFIMSYYIFLSYKGLETDKMLLRQRKTEYPHLPRTPVKTAVHPWLLLDKQLPTHGATSF